MRLLQPYSAGISPRAHTAPPLCACVNARWQSPSLSSSSHWLRAWGWPHRSSGCPTPAPLQHRADSSELRPGPDRVSRSSGSDAAIHRRRPPRSAARDRRRVRGLNVQRTPNVGSREPGSSDLAVTQEGLGLARRSRQGNAFRGVGSCRPHGRGLVAAEPLGLRVAEPGAQRGRGLPRRVRPRFSDSVWEWRESRATRRSHRR
jgi:hypothetical protein